MNIAGKPLSAYRLREREVAWGPMRGPGMRQPSLWEFVILSMLLHALAIALFGAPAGGSREGRAMWGSLNVVLQGLAPEPPPLLKLDRGALAEPPQPNIPRVRRAYVPPNAEPSPQLRMEPAIPNVEAPKIETPLAEPPKIIAPPVEVKPIAIPPLMERLPPQERNFESPTFQVPPPTEIQAPAPVPSPPVPTPKKLPKVAPPVEAPPPQPIEAAPQPVPAQAPLAAPRIERVVVPPVETPLLQPIERPVLQERAPVPPIEVPPIPTQAVPAVPTPAVPAAPPVEVKQVPTPPVQAPPVEVKQVPTPPIENIVPRVETTSKPVEKAPVQEVPVAPPPAVAPAAPAPRIEPARVEPPARAEPAPRETAPARAEPTAPKEQALPRPSTSPFGNPSFPNETGRRRGEEQPSSDYDPFASPREIDLDAMRKRAAQLAREGSGQRALLPFPLPPVPPRKSKMEEAIENARKPDCRTAYQALGLAAVVPLVANEFGEGNCRW